VFAPTCLTHGSLLWLTARVSSGCRQTSTRQADQSGKMSERLRRPRPEVRHPGRAWSHSWTALGSLRFTRFGSLTRMASATSRVPAPGPFGRNRGGSGDRCPLRRLELVPAGKGTSSAVGQSIDRASGVCPGGDFSSRTRSRSASPAPRSGESAEVPAFRSKRRRTR
jgi:hypothetical protein